MVIFGAMAMVIVVAAGTILLLQTGGATDDPQDSELYLFLGIIGAGVPLAWTAMNLWLLRARQQTGGQYVSGVRLVREDGTPLTIGNILLWWFALNPLLFSWPMALVTGFPLAALIALAVNSLSLAVFVVVMILCIAAPIAAFMSALVDRQNRGLHDRIVQTVVAPVAA